MCISNIYRYKEEFGVKRMKNKMCGHRIRHKYSIAIALHTIKSWQIESYVLFVIWVTLLMVNQVQVSSRF